MTSGYIWLYFCRRRLFINLKFTTMSETKKGITLGTDEIGKITDSQFDKKYTKGDVVMMVRGMLGALAGEKARRLGEVEDLKKLVDGAEQVLKIEKSKLEVVMREKDLLLVAKKEGEAVLKKDEFKVSGRNFGAMVDGVRGFLSSRLKKKGDATLGFRHIARALTMLTGVEQEFGKFIGKNKKG